MIIMVGLLNAQPVFPELKFYATDLTGTLSSTELEKLNTALQEFENVTSNQVVFLMVNTTDEYTVESYAYEVAAKNKIGSSKNNGVLFLVAKDDRKMRIEVGYGLEGALPDALSGSILRNDVKPFFKRDQYYQGIVNGINSIVLATKGEYKGEGKKRGNSGDEKGFKFPFIYIIIGIIFLILRIGGGKRGGGGGGGGVASAILWGSILSNAGRSSGGGFGGGSFGGFSGGGGSFGGGGSSGSW